jgi:hypothetical protein
VLDRNPLIGRPHQCCQVDQWADYPIASLHGHESIQQNLYNTLGLYRQCSIRGHWWMAEK